MGGSGQRQRNKEVQNRRYDMARIRILKHDCGRVYKKDKAEFLAYKERLKNIIDMNGEAPRFEENGHFQPSAVYQNG